MEDDGKKKSESELAGQDTYDKLSRLKAGMFLATVTGMSVLAGFGLTMGMAKRSDPDMFVKGVAGTKEMPESGVSLATRALMRGTLYSCTGFGLLCFAVWKLMGVHSMAEFREKVGSALPKIPKNDNPGRGDFKTLRDLLEFIIVEDEKEKLRKSRAKTMSENSSS